MDVAITAVVIGIALRTALAGYALEGEWVIIAAAFRVAVAIRVSGALLGAIACAGTLAAENIVCGGGELAVLFAIQNIVATIWQLGVLAHAVGQAAVCCVWIEVIAVCIYGALSSALALYALIIERIC